MNVVELSKHDHAISSKLDAIATLAARNHKDLRAKLPFLPERDAHDFYPPLAWMYENGRILSLVEDGRILAFLAGFIIENFRNAGPGAYSPDWCHGFAYGDKIAEGIGALRAYRSLYREIAPLWIEDGAEIHAKSLYSVEVETLEAFSLTGFGRIVMDAARPTEALIATLTSVTLGSAALRADSRAPRIRLAEPRDAEALAALDSRLAEHIAASPVLMPDTHGSNSAEWAEWFGGKDAVAFVAEENAALIGFIKAEAPQFDVSRAVQADTTLAIDGMFVAPEIRSAGVGRALLRQLALYARESGKTMVSVDCETMNPEAYAFWTKYFEPVSWSLERRV